MSIAKIAAIAGDIVGKLLKKQFPFNSDILGKLTGSLTFSSQRIQKEIGFKPKYNLYNTMDETIKWYHEESRYPLPPRRWKRMENSTSSI